MNSRDRNFEVDDRSFRDHLNRGSDMLANAALESLQQKLNTRLYDIQSLQVEPEGRGGIAGFGRRVIVPADQIHVVSGHGLHTNPALIKKETEVFGQAAGQPAVYWRNALTKVIALRTITFVVPVAGSNSIGVDVLDTNRVPFNVTAHVVAKLDESQPKVAAQSVGDDILGLAANIREVTEAQLLDAAAEMTLEDVLNDRQQLADKARDEVNATLTGLGYKLLYITIAELGGVAFEKLVEQAQAGVTRDTTIQINAAQLRTHESNQERARTEAQVNADTRTETEARRLTADQAVAIAESNKAEEVAARQNTLDLAAEKRIQALAEARHEVALRQISLTEAESLRHAESNAAVAAITQERKNALELEATLAEAERYAQEATKRIEREDLEAEKAAARRRNVKNTVAEAEAEALGIRTRAETDASELRATADVQLAQATRAKEAASGLALADVRAREVEIASIQVEVDKASGLAEAEVAKQKAEADIARERGLQAIRVETETQLAALYASTPALVELEKLRIQQQYALDIARVRADAQLAALQALAPQMNLNLNLIGDGGKVSQLMGSIMQIAAGLNVVGDQVPAVGNFLNNHGYVALPATEADDLSASSNGQNGFDLAATLQGFIPFIGQVVRDLNPRMFGRLTVADLADRLASVVSGQENLAVALDGLRKDAQFRMVADVPVAPFLQKLGLTPLTEDVQEAEPDKDSQSLLEVDDVKEPVETAEVKGGRGQRRTSS